MLLLCRANTSPTVLRDIERAIAYERPVLSIHLDDALPNASLEYDLNMWQWLDASAGVEATREAIVTAVREQLGVAAGAVAWRWLDAPAGVDARRKEIVATVQGQLSQLPAGPDRDAATAGPAKPRRVSRRTWLIAAGAAVCLLALGLGLGLGLPGAASHQGKWMRLDRTETTPPSGGVFVGYDLLAGRLLACANEDPQGLGETQVWAYDPPGNEWSQLKATGETGRRAAYRVPLATSRPPGD